MWERFGRFLCSIGLHWFGSIIEDSIRSTGKYTGTKEFVVQKGREICTRIDCGHQNKVWRQGFAGVDTLSGINMGAWMRMGPTEEEYINSLRYRQLMA